MVNKNIEVVKLEILKVKTWFCYKDLSKNNKMINKHTEVKDRRRGLKCKL